MDLFAPAALGTSLSFLVIFTAFVWWMIASLGLPHATVAPIAPTVLTTSAAPALPEEPSE
ncbi:hypothetical protein GBA52_012066 [Prunus armeniaca]|nr:hypothetical protein GBA52_012066 [Prunus armeniaca]